MTPEQLEELETGLRERAKPYGDSRSVNGIQLLAGDLAAVVAHIRKTEEASKRTDDPNGTKPPPEYFCVIDDRGDIVDDGPDEESARASAGDVADGSRTLYRYTLAAPGADERVLRSATTQAGAEIRRLKAALAEQQEVNEEFHKSLDLRDTRIADLEAKHAFERANANEWLAKLDDANRTIASMRPVVEAATRWVDETRDGRADQPLITAARAYQSTAGGGGEPKVAAKDAEYYAFCAQTCKCGHPRDVHSMVCSRCECGGFVPLDQPATPPSPAGSDVVQVEGIERREGTITSLLAEARRDAIAEIESFTRKRLGEWGGWGTDSTVEHVRWSAACGELESVLRECKALASAAAAGTVGK